MNLGIQHHFERLEQELCNSPAVRGYHILIQELAQLSLARLRRQRYPALG